MKKQLLLITATTVFIVLVLSGYSSGPAANGQGNRTVAGCGGSGCHGAASSPSGNVTVHISILDGTTPVTTYVPYRNYTVRIQGTNNLAGHSKFGFQLIAIQGANLNAQAGVFTATPGSGVAVRSGIGTLELVEHERALDGTIGSTGDLYDIAFNWKAPYPTFGPVTFRCVLNAVNGNMQADAGDGYNFATLQLSQANTGISQIASALPVSIYPSPAKDLLQVHVDNQSAQQYDLAVYDMTGSILIHSRFATTKTTVNVSTLPAGKYMVVVTNSNERGVATFVK